MSATESPDLVRVLQGTPDDVELAALVAVLTLRRAAPEPPPQPSAWSRPVWGRGVEVRAGRDAWRMSGLPR
ncbi:acyl-CoA carboxylase subunit epsilon [Amycolatopsis sp. A133]|uniref:acyl-CoA carboxylase subunit epsilon n=1 Tax=Amycolatopsis sp. A133 TaxID=3064472 RepID=UPI0027FD94A9|nr:acyl-CoA carboxylase subunit epsilon [Amycolatopsis sp. A133]MDQ7806732.1 acyl-CoA carboxylase subunit epsilon [Amycolatopsis sp. A133]